MSWASSCFSTLRNPARSRYSPPCVEKNPGLKLEKLDQPMPIVVIDNLDRVPIEN